MRIHREGRNILLFGLITIGGLHGVVVQYTGLASKLYIFFSATTVLLYAWLIWFFRDPHRRIHTNEAQVLSPADGTVVAIEEVLEGEYFQTKRTQISVFMSPFNVHVNRAPVAGTLTHFKYHPGEYLVAWHPKSSTKNERTTIVVTTEKGTPVLFRQIAGFLARRIKFYPQVGDIVTQGQECGFIKFGSRVDVFLPLEARVQVRLGDRVKGGITALANL